MNRTFRIYFCLALTCLAASACEKIIGIESKYLAVEPDSGAAGTACTAISTNGVGLRIANMIPVERKVDVCVAAAGANFPQYPLFASNGSECPKGVGYGQYTVRLNVGAGTYQVKLVPYGSTCDAEGPTLSGVRVDAPTDTAHTSSTTVVADGKGWSTADARLVALKDADRTGGDIYLRFFHALVDAGNLDAGLVDDKQTPPAMTFVIFGDVPFGATAAARSGNLPVDAQGYMVYPVKSGGVGGLELGAGLSGEAFINSFVTLTLEHHYTLFLMGQSGNAQFPPKLWSCDETSSYGAFTDCGEPYPITLGVYHPNLTDQFTDYVDVRETAALKAIATADGSTGSTANALCIPELYPPEVRAGLKKQLGNTTVVFSDDYPISPASDLTDQSGNLPQYKSVVCDGGLQEQMQAFEACLLDPQLQAAGCITAGEAGEGDGGVSKHYFAFKGKPAIGCAAEACQTQVANLVFAESFEADACFMCAIAHLSSGESIEDMYAACTSPNPSGHHFVYGGSTGLAAIIKPPLVLATNDAPEVVALPASTWNRAALRVPVKLPNGAALDIWCASVRAPNSETFLPNGGPYYGEATASVTDIEKANAAEENLQISRLIATVNQHASNRQKRAIVAALTYASPQIGDQVTGSHLENFALFDNQNWNELVAHNYAPACTFCGDNALNSPQDDQWMEHVFGIGIDADMVTDTQRTFTGNALNLVLYSTPDQTPTPVPLSQYYGIQSTVRISQ